MDKLNYLLRGFGFKNISDYLSSLFRFDSLKVWLSFLLGGVLEYTGLDSVVLLAFVGLIVAEFQTGIKVSMQVNGERFKSRKFGRMILKIGTYILIVSVLHSFSTRMHIPKFLGFDVNPFLWLYYSVFIAIVFQLFISWMENLGCLGYKETKTIAGFILRKFNKWFEFDGTKNNGDN